LVLGLVKVLPESRPAKSLPVKQLHFLVLQNAQGQILLEKRPPVGIWGGLWSLPEFADLAQLQTWCLQHHAVIDSRQTLLPQRHTFSHYHLDYTPIRASLINPINNVMEANASLWYKTADIDTVGLPTPIKRLLQQNITEENYDENG